MRIGIDARLYGPIDRGLGRYSQKLIEYLAEVDSENEYFIFLRKNGFQNYQPRHKNFHKVLADFQPYSFKEQFFYPWQLLRYRLDLVHFLHFNVPVLYLKRFIVTIHDLIISRYPTSRHKATTRPLIFYQFKLFFYQLVLRLAVWRARKIIAVSKFTKKEIIDVLKVAPFKVIVIYEGVDKLETRNLKLEIKNLYILYVGAAYPHKNLERLFRAFKKLITHNPSLTTPNLVMVGKKDYFYQRLEKYATELGLKDRVIFTDEISDEDLTAFYQKAIFLIFPSLSEGFGFPGLEAMKNGLPVAAANSSSLPEIFGKAALYFDPKQEEEMVQVMKELIDNQSLREKLRKKGFQQAKKYQWLITAKKTFGLYKIC